MSISSEISRISGNVEDAFEAIEGKGVTVPSGSTSDDLADLISQISGGGSIVISDTTDSAGGTIRTITATTVRMQSKSNISPTTSSQTIEPDNGYTGLSSVQINAVASGSATTPATSITANPSISVDSSGLITATASATKSVTPTVSAGYVSSGTSGTITVTGSNTSQLSTQAGTTATPTTSEQTIVAAGKYTTGAIKVSAMPTGTAGTPTATKGTVSNHSVSVTPSVTNTTGYITGSTKTGTAVTVSASELVSGNKEITANGTNIDVATYSTVSVAVPSGTSKNTQVMQSTSRTTATSLTKVLGDMTVSKAGTYDVYWSGARTNTSSGYTWGTRLYIDGIAYGTENTTWTNNVQSNHLSNVSLTANQKLSVYARGRGGSYYACVPMLTIVEA